MISYGFTRSRLVVSVNDDDTGELVKDAVVSFQASRLAAEEQRDVDGLDREKQLEATPKDTLRWEFPAETKGELAKEGARTCFIQAEWIRNGQPYVESVEFTAGYTQPEPKDDIEIRGR